MQQLPQGGKNQLSTLSVLTRAATASVRAAEIEKQTGAYSRTIPIAKVRVKPQVRRDFSDIADFAERLKQIGHVHSPILVREIKGADEYELIAGERRVRGSKINEWHEIPAKVFPADTPDIMIRKYQVSENIDRKSLSLPETAIGLAADVEQYGRDEAARIWTGSSGKQRSASWISKHLRFQKYGPLTRELFDANLFDDIEAANKLDDIEAISADVAAEIAADMRAGRKIGRTALDARLNILKEGERTQEAPPASQGAEDSQESATAPLHDAAAPVQEAEQAAAIEPPIVGPSANVATWATQLTSAGKSTSGPAASPPVEGPAKHAASESAPQPESSREPAGVQVTQTAVSANAPRVKQQHAANADPKSTVLWRIQEIYEVGTTSIGRLRALQRDLAAAGMSEEDSEWRLWIAFNDIVASAMVGVGPETGGKILNRFVTELNSRGPLELLNRLHPTAKPGVLPDDFGYDTDREIHPLAPGNWSL